MLCVILVCTTVDTPWLLHLTVLLSTMLPELIVQKTTKSNSFVKNPAKHNSTDSSMIVIVQDRVTTVAY